MLSSAHCFSCPGLPWLKAGYFCSALYMLKLQYRVIGLCKLTKISLNVGAKHKSLVSYRRAATTAAWSHAVTAWDMALQPQDLVHWKEGRAIALLYRFSRNFAQGTSLHTSKQPNFPNWCWQKSNHEAEVSSRVCHQLYSWYWC